VASHVPDNLNHTGAASFDDHLDGVRSVLASWGCGATLCNAGLFHSIYGTEGFQGYALPLEKRAEIQGLVGERAERLSWIFCMVDRASVDASLADPAALAFRARPELGAFPIPLADEEEWLDFLALTLADWLEQVEGAAEGPSVLFEWPAAGHAYGYRREAYAAMAEILVERRGLTAAAKMHKEVMATEGPETRSVVQPITPPMSDAARKARAAIASSGGATGV